MNNTIYQAKLNQHSATRCSITTKPKVMKNSEKLNIVDLAIATNKKVKVFFNSETRRPVFGQFVKTNDYSELRKKDMARFVLDEKMPEYVGTGFVWISKIYAMDAVFYIKLF